MCNNDEKRSINGMYDRNIRHTSIIRSIDRITQINLESSDFNRVREFVYAKLNGSSDENKISIIQKQAIVIHKLLFGKI